MAVTHPNEARAPRGGARVLIVCLAAAMSAPASPDPAPAGAPAASSAPAARAAPMAAPPPAPAAPAARAAALAQLDAADEGDRLVAVQRLAELGTMDDIQRLLRALRDASEPVREAATLTLWSVWSRSGDAAIDRQLAEGMRLMSEGALAPALAVFDHVVRERPDFAEGWNRRATVLFLMGRDDESLHDCDEVLRRNPWHFGAMSGMAQLHLRRGDPERALKTYERALEVNPNLRNGPAVLRLLEEAVRQRRATGAT